MSKVSAIAGLLCGVLLLCLPGCAKKKEVRLELASVGETMAYDKKELTVPAGSRVTVVLKNNATSPVMTHNWVLVYKGKTDEVGTAAIKVSAEQGHLPENSNIITHTPLSKPGETVQVTFDAPPPGTYEFLCTTPGHYLQMRGTFVVQ